MRPDGKQLFPSVTNFSDSSVIHPGAASYLKQARQARGSAGERRVRDKKRDWKAYMETQEPGATLTPLVMESWGLMDRLYLDFNSRLAKCAVQDGLVDERHAGRYAHRLNQETSVALMIGNYKAARGWTNQARELLPTPSSAARPHAVWVDPDARLADDGGGDGDDCDASSSSDASNDDGSVPITIANEASDDSDGSCGANSSNAGFDGGSVTTTITNGASDDSDCSPAGGGDGDTDLSGLFDSAGDPIDGQLLFVDPMVVTRVDAAALRVIRRYPLSAPLCSDSPSFTCTPSTRVTDYIVRDDDDWFQSPATRQAVGLRKTYHAVQRQLLRRFTRQARPGESA
jgi:hypothetical protein